MTEQNEDGIAPHDSKAGGSSTSPSSRRSDRPLTDIVDVRWCDRCGSPLTDENLGNGCQECVRLDEMLKDWLPDAKERHLAKVREQGRRLEQEFRGKTIGQFEREGRRYQQRAEAPPPQIDLSLEVSVLNSSHSPVPGYTLTLSLERIDLFIDLGPIWSCNWAELEALTTHGPSAPEQRATLSRAAAFGLFSLGFKKERRYAYLTIIPTNGSSYSFLVEGLMKHDLDARLAPVQAWLARNPPLSAQT